MLLGGLNSTLPDANHHRPLGFDSRHIWAPPNLGSVFTYISVRRLVVRPGPTLFAHRSKSCLKRTHVLGQDNLCCARVLEQSRMGPPVRYRNKILRTCSS